MMNDETIALGVRRSLCMHHAFVCCCSVDAAAEGAGDPEGEGEGAGEGDE